MQKKNNAAPASGESSQSDSELGYQTPVELEKQIIAESQVI